MGGSAWPTASFGNDANCPSVVAIIWSSRFLSASLPTRAFFQGPLPFPTSFSRPTFRP